MADEVLGDPAAAPEDAVEEAETEALDDDDGDGVIAVDENGDEPEEA